MAEEKLKREMPQVRELLRTTFRAQVLAYRDADGHVHQTLPPYPARIHTFVTVCSIEDQRMIGAPFDIFPTMIFNPDPSVPVDDLVVAVLRQRYRAFDGGPDGEAELINAGRALSRLLNDDHERLQSILRRAI